MIDDKKLLITMREWVQEIMQHSMHAFIHYSKEIGLSMSQVSTLFRIYRSEMNSVTDIGEDLGISNAAASQMVDRMVQQGLIERIENPEDRRSKRLSLTDKGRAIVWESINVRQVWMEDLVRSMTPKEKEMTMEAFTMLTQKNKSIAAGRPNAFAFVKGCIQQ